MIEEGFFISKESLTPQEWKEFSSFAASLNLSEKEAILHLMLQQIKQKNASDTLKKILSAFHKSI